MGLHTRTLEDVSRLLCAAAQSTFPERQQQHHHQQGGGLEKVWEQLQDEGPQVSGQWPAAVGAEAAQDAGGAGPETLEKNPAAADLSPIS